MRVLHVQRLGDPRDRVEFGRRGSTGVVLQVVRRHRQAMQQQQAQQLERRIPTAGPQQPHAFIGMRFRGNACQHGHVRNGVRSRHGDDANKHARRDTRLLFTSMSPGSRACAAEKSSSPFICHVHVLLTPAVSIIVTTVCTCVSAASRLAYPQERAMQDLPTTREQFWRVADAAKEATEALAAQRMRILPSLDIAELRGFCVQYRFFTIDYITDLALLVSRLPFGGLRSLLGQILSEELGEGDPARAHPTVYDRFLSSIGVDDRDIERVLPANARILQGLTRDLTRNPVAYGVGLRGMGGECLCQTYLSVMFEHMRTHPYLRANEDRIDWEFWTIHTGEEDIVHGELTRAAIDEYLRHDPSVLPELARGYERSISAWNLFWQNILDAHAPQLEVAS
ncbi:hypothetical protein C0063_13330 [Pseudoxanthomonas sp. KAs_5_3]|nr:hypothetical protein C0063_13330 [Pseudoxanthomonas sp. KAs_5_3]